MAKRVKCSNMVQSKKPNKKQQKFMLWIEQSHHMMDEDLYWSEELGEDDAQKLSLYVEDWMDP